MRVEKTVLSAYLDPLHMKVWVVRSPVTCLYAVCLQYNLLSHSLSLFLSLNRVRKPTWEIFLSGFCKTFPRREEMIMVAEVEADVDIVELSLLNIC